MDLDVDSLADSENTHSSDTSNTYHDDELEDMEHLSVPGFFKDAVLYKQVLDEHFPYGQGSYAAAQSVQSFAALVGDDLTPTEQEVAGRFAQLSVEDWVPQEYAGTPPLSEEPEDIGDEDSSSSSSQEHIADTPPSAVADDSVAQKELPVLLAPDEIVSLFRQEFGPLGPDGEETLVSEVDGAIIQDVIILGVIHLTTHRIAFHASLPKSDPSLSATSQIIKAGNAMIHRKGLHRKRRVWLELSHDFISAFPSARDEDRIRPWRSVKLNSIMEVYPENPHHPRHINFLMNGTNTGIMEGSIEFDTLESARDWRREIQAALFFSRRSYHHLLANPLSEEMEGVRICIPLDRISKIEQRIQANTVPIISLTISSPDNRHSSDEIAAGATAPQVIELAAYKCDERWNEMAVLIQKAKERAEVDKVNYPDREVVVEIGLADVLDSSSEESNVASEPVSMKDRTICDMLAIDYTPDIWVTRACILTVLHSVGFIVVSSQWFGFWSKSLALKDVQYRLPMTSIRRAVKSGGGLRALLLYGMQLEIEGHANLKFYFTSETIRAEAIKRINDMSKASASTSASQSPARSPMSLETPPLTPTSTKSLDLKIPTAQSPRSVTPSRSRSTVYSRDSLLAPLGRSLPQLRKDLDPSKILQFPKAVNPPCHVVFTAKPKHFVCLTIGSRGDVQPYIALGLRLKKDGHRVTIVTHPEYSEWIEGFGLTHRAAGGDPGALMQLSVENKMFSPQFFKTGLSNYRSWLDQLLVDAWNNCCDAEVLLESPYAMAGVHIAEALNIPYFRVCTMPWSKTSEFPHPFIGPPVETPTANSISYVLFDNVFWAATSGQINRWRRDHLKLGSIVMSHTAQSKLPVLYEFSAAVVPMPLDWSDSMMISGYWFLDNPDLDWTPSDSLLEFMKQARDDDKPLVYVGFGSITVPNPQTMTEHIFQAIVKSDVRAIVSRGWSSRMSKKTVQEIDTPKECYMVDKIPHDWLFSRIDAALHHGGAGTTGASLRAGIPTLIKPWFGDQYFWASRVAKLGAGLRVHSLRVNDLVYALTKATTDRVIKEKAALVGQKIRAEDGVGTAAHNIYTYLPRVTSTGLTPQ